MGARRGVRNTAQIETELILQSICCTSGIRFQIPCAPSHFTHTTRETLGDVTSRVTQNLKASVAVGWHRCASSELFCVALSELLSLSRSVFPHLQAGNDNTTSMRNKRGNACKYALQICIHVNARIQHTYAFSKRWASQ